MMLEIFPTHKMTDAYSSVRSNPNSWKDLPTVVFSVYSGKDISYGKTALTERTREMSIRKSAKKKKRE